MPAYIGEVRLYAGVGDPPPGWLDMDGRELPTAGNEILAGILDSGPSTLRLPDARSRTPVGRGGPPGEGVEVVALTSDQMPSHNHAVGTAGAAWNSTSPSGSVLADNTLTDQFYTPGPIPDSALNSDSVSNVGGGQPHSNIQPFLALRLIIRRSGFAPMAGTCAGGGFAHLGGMLLMFAFSSPIPAGMMPTDGTLLDATVFTGLLALLGNAFGGDGVTTFGLPNTAGKAFVGAGHGAGLSPYSLFDQSGELGHVMTLGGIPSHRHDFIAVSDPSNRTAIGGRFLASNVCYQNTPGAGAMGAAFIGYSGSDQPHENRQPFLELSVRQAVDDIDPGQDLATATIVIGPWTVPPTGMQLCDGSFLTVAAEPALFAAIGYTFGGSGANFNVPDLQGRIPVCVSPAFAPTQLSQYDLGQTGGAETVTLGIDQIPSHSHSANGALVGTVQTAAGNLLGNALTGSAPYRDSGTRVTMHADQIRPTGGSAGHGNLMPQIAWKFYVVK